MKTKTILVTGGDGMVGSYVSKTFNSKNYEVVIAGKGVIDVTNKKSIEKQIKKLNPSLIIHLAAKTNVDECEKDPESAFLINYEGTKNVADICKKYGSVFVYVSTSAVFNGKKKSFSEKDAPNPVNIYGKSKLAGEKYIQDNLEKYYIVRAGWMIGGGKKEKKFISYIINQINSSKSIKVVNDKFGTITYAKEFVEFIKKLFEKSHPYGTYHFGSRGVCSRFDIAKKIVDILDKKVDIIPVSSKEFSSNFFAPRPKNEVLRTVNQKFTSTWRKSLYNYLSNEII